MFDSTIFTSLIADCAWKASAILIAAGALSLALRRGSASVRHLVWVSAIAGALLIPVVAATFPQWTVRLWRDLLPVEGAGLFRIETAALSAEAAPARVAAQPVNEPGRAPARPAPITPAIPFTAIWMAGAGLSLVPLAISRIALVRLARKSRPAREGVVSLARSLREAMGIGSSVRLLETATPASPVTWGILRPVILIPSVAADGDPRRLRAILIHELAHIGRADYLWQTLGQLACAFYWFHPLVRLAQHQALRLRERAADDMVLRSGERATDYAGDLVRLARALTAPRLCGSLAIARPSNLETRVRAILDPTVRRSARSRTLVMAGLSAAMLFTLAVAAMRPAAAEIPSLAFRPGGIAAAVQPGQAIASTIDVAGLETRAAAADAAYDFDEAAGLLRRALDDRKTRFGEDSVEYARGLANLGALCGEWNKADQASAYYSKALPALEKHLGANDPELFAPLHYLAVDAHARQDRLQAASLYQRAIDIQSANRIAGPGAALAMAELAIVKLESKDAAKASQLVDEALAIAPKDSLERATTFAAQAQVLRALGRDADADEASRQAQETQKAWAAQQPAPPKFPGTATEPGDKGPFRIGPGITPPWPVEKKEPEYSAEARINELQGTTVLSIIVGEDGHPRAVRVIRPLGMGLDQQAVEAIRQWRFEPARKDGEPVAVYAMVEINFRLL